MSGGIRELAVFGEAQPVDRLCGAFAFLDFFL